MIGTFNVFVPATDCRSIVSKVVDEPWALFRFGWSVGPGPIWKLLSKLVSGSDITSYNPFLFLNAIFILFFIYRFIIVKTKLYFTDTYLIYLHII